MATPPPEGPASQVSPQHAPGAKELPPAQPLANGPTGAPADKRKPEAAAADEPPSKRQATGAAETLNPAQPAPAAPSAPESVPALAAV